jgi:hypothetical protein
MEFLLFVPPAILLAVALHKQRARLVAVAFIALFLVAAGPGGKATRRIMGGRLVPKDVEEIYCGRTTELDPKGVDETVCCFAMKEGNGSISCGGEALLLKDVMLMSWGDEKL